MGRREREVAAVFWGVVGEVGNEQKAGSERKSGENGDAIVRVDKY